MFSTLDVNTRHTNIQSYMYILSSSSPGNLTFANVNSSLGHEAHASLWFLATVCAEVVHIGWLICDLKIANAAVPLGVDMRKT